MKDTPPPSAVPAYIGAAGLVGCMSGLGINFSLDIHPALGLALLLTTTALPMYCLESRRLNCRSMCQSATLSDDMLASRRTACRVRGLLLVSMLWAGTLSVLPLADSGTLNGFWEAIAYLWPALALATAFYLFRSSTQYIGGVELLGRWSTNPHSHTFPWTTLRDQLVKAVFLPLMLAFAYSWQTHATLLTDAGDLRWYLLPIATMYLVDTVFGTVGYLSTIHGLDAHIRSSNPSLLGWCVALVCYPPIFTWLQAAGFNYHDSVEWQDWLGVRGAVAWTWGGCILLATAIYTWSTVSFGIRFSNLTNRGIITSGPYRFSKHPAYISKNISWWLISVPFLNAGSASQAVLHCTVLVGMNVIYWLRAMTEERHLMSDPAYRVYANWIESHGTLARARQVFFKRAA